MVEYFKNSYIEARKIFREKAEFIKSKYPDSLTKIIKVPSKTDNDLTVDILFVPPISDSKKLLIISSGVHGIEGYTGHAIQSMFFDKFLNDDLLKHSGLMLIHSVNPYGFKYFRRVSENNVDINRNSFVNLEFYKTENKGYPRIKDLINPVMPVSMSSFKTMTFYLKAVRRIMKEGMAPLRQAVLQGQYNYPKCLYFGGNKQEPQIESLKNIIEDLSSDFNSILAIDLHTGYGERGKLHLFPNPLKEHRKKKIEKLFRNYKIDWGDSDDFYIVTGDFVGFIRRINKNKDKSCYPMVFEYGTMDTQKTSGSIKSIKRTILENQGAQYGYKTERDSKKVRKMFREMHYPSSEKWRKKVIEDTEKLLSEILPRFCSDEF